MPTFVGIGAQLRSDSLPTFDRTHCPLWVGLRTWGLSVDTLTIRIPIRLQRRGGRKVIVTPDGAAVPALKARRDETLVRALVRAHRWRRRIESGQAKSITDLAEQEGVTDAYVCRLLPLTCLAPDIVETMLDGRQPRGLRLAEVLGNGPLAWQEQRLNWLFV